MRHGILTCSAAGIFEIDLDIVSKNFQDTRLHKSFKKIVADSFITESVGKCGKTYILVNVKNSIIQTKAKISEAQAQELIQRLSLVSERVFNLGKTWRTVKGTNLVADLLSKHAESIL